MTRLLHARFWHYDGSHNEGHDCPRYDPHGFGLKTITAMAYLADQVEVGGVSMEGVVVRHHKGDQFGHQVHVAATRSQWDAAKKWMEQQDGR